MKVLFVSYYYHPFPGVGAKRTTYWANNLAKHGIQADVLTATKQEEPSANITYLEPKPASGLLSKLIKDPGLHWKNQLAVYFNNITAFNYDVVVFSGGPFMHFGVGALLQKKFGVKVVLDYRDPFGYNPRHNDSWLKKTIKTHFEKKFNKAADAITTVNEVCKATMTFKEKVTVIANGYDDEILDVNELEDKAATEGLILNGGKLYGDFNLAALLDVLKKDEGLRFSQVGAKSEMLDDLNSERITSEGFMAYEDLVKRIQSAEICTVLTGGKPFETPTKTYDYIALNKKILVLTEGPVKSGGIQSILSGYPNAEWAENKQEAILQAIKNLQARPLEKFNPYPYSRAYSLEKFVALLKAL